MRHLVAAFKGDTMKDQRDKGKRPQLSKNRVPEVRTRIKAGLVRSVFRADIDHTTTTFRFA